MAGHGRLVWAEGNGKGRVAVVLDNPGAREDAAGNPFVCGTRITLRDAIWDAGLRESDVYLTFLIKCRPRKAYDRLVVRSLGLPILSEQLRKHQPRLIVLLGDVVTQTVTGDSNASVRTLRGKSLTIDGFRAVVGYHPLATRRRPNLYSFLVQDLARARALLNSDSGQD